MTGQNFNLAHSGGMDGGELSDHTCLMGNPLESDEVGKMCFNPAKNWQLDWYGGQGNSSQHKTLIDPFQTETSSLQLVGIGEFDKNAANHPVVIKIETHNSTGIFIGFNRAAGPNAENKEAGDEITIIEAGNSGKYYSQSYLKAHLLAGETYTDESFASSGRSLTITANSIDLTTTPGVASVTITLQPSSPSTMPSFQPTTTKAPSSQPSPLPSIMLSLSPTAKLSKTPSFSPTTKPSSPPSTMASSQPSSLPSIMPSSGERDAVQKFFTEFVRRGSDFFESFCSLAEVTCHDGGFVTSTLHHCDWKFSCDRNCFRPFKGVYHSNKGVFCNDDGFVTDIDLSYEGVRGSIPTEVGMLSKLQELDLRSNDISGSLPTEVGMLSDLQYLILVQNDITGSIPSEIGMLSQLRYLGLEENDISGTLPSEVCMLSDIFLIALDDNRDNDDDDSPDGYINREDINSWCESLR
uniref:Uncharacterized protein n=1 Tax=Ditylum brightwellii TaxID=49249 RepID=A0A7S4S5M4_9STRA